ncbi:MAG: hypothetical protein GY952_13915 [Rhodobacteraceae bacterium]|nr:hypothetical protein [Paracoccaceae bacterium]
MTDTLSEENKLHIREINTQLIDHLLEFESVIENKTRCSKEKKAELRHKLRSIIPDLLIGEKWEGNWCSCCDLLIFESDYPAIHAYPNGDLLCPHCTKICEPGNGHD